MAVQKKNFLQGRLYLIPVPIGGDDFRAVIPDKVISITLTLRYFVVENIRSARRYLRLIDKTFPLDDVSFAVLDEHSCYKDITGYLDAAVDGFDIGLMSEAGIPGIADPGAELIRLAHRKGIEVIPLAGPSSVFLALAASGLNGQNFRFNGYLPVKEDALRAKIREMEKRSAGGETQIFMEAPYRNRRLLKNLVETCSGETFLCIACDITLSGGKVVTRKIKEWEKNIPEINDHPSVFLLQTLI